LSAKQKLAHEAKAVAIATAFFAGWFLALLAVKNLILADYGITFGHYARAIIGALVVGKVVLLLEHVGLGRVPAWVDVVARTLIYGVGVFLVLWLEKGIDGRHASGGVLPAMGDAVGSVDMDHAVATTIVVLGALLVFNAASVVRRHHGDRGVWRMFAQPLPPAGHGERADPPADRARVPVERPADDQAPAH